MKKYNGITEKQSRVINHIYNEVEKKHKLDEAKYGEKYNFKMELKNWEIKTSDTGLVFIIVEWGRVGDEKNLNSIYSRDRRHICIGKQGGCTLLNAYRSAKENGLYNAIHALTESCGMYRKTRTRRAA